MAIKNQCELLHAEQSLKAISLILLPHSGAGLGSVLSELSSQKLGGSTTARGG